jgi:hypothetical protein
MIKWFFKWLFRQEHEELQRLISRARNLGNEKPVQYKVFDPNSKAFLFAMNEVSGMPEVRFWLLEKQREVDALIKYSTDGNRDQNIGRSMLIDELVGSLDKAKANYAAILEYEQRIQNAKV